MHTRIYKYILTYVCTHETIITIKVVSIFVTHKSFLVPFVISGPHLRPTDLTLLSLFMHLESDHLSSLTFGNCHWFIFLSQRPGSCFSWLVYVVDSQLLSLTATYKVGCTIPLLQWRNQGSEWWSNMELTGLESNRARIQT